MARNTPLMAVLQMLKAEIGQSLLPGVASADDLGLSILIEQRQRWLATEFDWAFLKSRADVVVPGGTDDLTRYPTLPLTINFERPVDVKVMYNTQWLCVEFGISEQHYNIFSSGDAAVSASQQDPISNWDYKPGDDTKFEIWPLAQTAQTVRFEGYRPLGSLRDASMSEGGAPALVFDYTATLDLDDQLVVLFVAAEILGRKKKEDAKAKMALAEARLARLRATTPTDNKAIVLGSGGENPSRRYKKIKVN